MNARRAMGSSVLARLAWVIFAAAAPGRAYGLPPPTSAYAQIESAGTARMSPDGKLIAYIDGDGSRLLVRVTPIDGHTITSFDTRSWTPDWLDWKDNQTLLVSLRQTQTSPGSAPVGATRLMVLAADGHRSAMMRLQPAIRLPFQPFDDTTGAAPITPNLQDRMLSDLRGRGSQLLIEVGDRVVDRPDVYRADIWDRIKQLVMPAQPGVTDWVADQNGVVRAGSVLEESSQISVFNHRLIARRSAADSWHRLPFEAYELAFSATDPATLYAIIGSDSEDSRLVRINIDTGTITRTFARAPEDRITMLTENNVMVGYQIENDAGAHSFYLDPGRARLAAAIAAALKADDVQLGDFSSDGKRVTALVTRRGRPAELWLLDRAQKRPVLNPLLADYEDIPASQIAPARWVRFQARDGLWVPARLTLPLTAPHGAISFVLLPHGGPASYDGSGFDWLSQFLASRGWGVLQPEFRGSTGYGWKFESLGKQQWGLAMQDDLTDATRWLIDQKLADPAKICIVGASYGGYAALEGAVKEPNLYACAAAFAPVTNLPEFLAEEKSFSFSDMDLVDIGNPSTLAAVSPALHADQIRIPILLVQGRNDFTVPDTQTEMMETALEQAGKTEQTIYLPDADHYLSRPADRLAWLYALDGFLGRYLGGG